METSKAHHAQIIWDIVLTITPQITKGPMEILTGTDPLIKGETHSTTLPTHPEAGTIALFQWT
jgi:hypothetical protein